MTARPDPLDAVRALGVDVSETWDYDSARANAVENITRMRREDGAIFRQARRMAFDMRAELGEDLPGIPSELVEKITITLLAKVLALAVGQGADPLPVLAAGAVATLAVLDEFWSPS